MAKTENKVTERPKIENGRILSIMIFVAGLGGAIWILLGPETPGPSNMQPIISASGMVCTCVPATPKSLPPPHNMAASGP
jgi:hypothetical protein